MAPAFGGPAADLARSKLDEFFWEWLGLPESQKIVRQALQVARGEHSRVDTPAPSPNFHALRSSPTGRPSPPGSPLAHKQRELSSSEGEWQASPPQETSLSPSNGAKRDSELLGRSFRTEDGKGVGKSMLAMGAKVIPRFYWPKRQKPAESLSPEVREAIHAVFVRQNLSEGLRTHAQLEPIVTEVFKLSKYFVVPIFHKIKAFHKILHSEGFLEKQIGDASVKVKTALLNASPTPITEKMLLDWAQGRIQVDDVELSFFHVVKKDNNDWIQREDFSIFLNAVLLTHPGLDFLRETQEFQERYADTVISRIFFIYDRKDVGKIPLSCLRRHKPSVVDAWMQLADHDDIKMVKDYFSYEHFYVIYCTFWELDSDHDFLLDKDDLLKYDGHALSRRTVDRIFSEVTTKFTSTVPGKMGYEDFIRFLLCDQDRQTDRSMEYWFNMFDMDGDGCIRDHEMKYFYEEQVQRMECLNYDTVAFADVLCQMNDMISPKAEGVFRLADFKRKRKFAATFFSLFSSLNKFLAFEHRDPFVAKQDALENPGASDWDRWCADEYLRLAMEEGGEEVDEGDS